MLVNGGVVKVVDSTTVRAILITTRRLMFRIATDKFAFLLERVRVSELHRDFESHMGHACFRRAMQCMMSLIRKNSTVIQRLVAE